MDVGGDKFDRLCSSFAKYHVKDRGKVRALLDAVGMKGAKRLLKLFKFKRGEEGDWEGTENPAAFCNWAICNPDAVKYPPSLRPGRDSDDADTAGDDGVVDDGVVDDGVGADRSERRRRKREREQAAHDDDVFFFTRRERLVLRQSDEDVPHRANHNGEKGVIYDPHADD